MTIITTEFAKDVCITLDCFNYERASNILKNLDIFWTIKGVKKIPTAEDIKDIAIDTLWKTIEQGIENKSDWFTEIYDLRFDFYYPKTEDDKLGCKISLILETSYN